MRLSDLLRPWTWDTWVRTPPRSEVDGSVPDGADEQTSNTRRADAWEVRREGLDLQTVRAIEYERLRLGS